MAFQEGFSSDEGESGNSQGCLLFEYLERGQPYSREPLADKVLFLFHPEWLYYIVPVIFIWYNKLERIQLFLPRRYLILPSIARN